MSVSLRRKDRQAKLDYYILMARQEMANYLKFKEFTGTICDALNPHAWVYNWYVEQIRHESQHLDTLDDLKRTKFQNVMKRQVRLTAQPNSYRHSILQEFTLLKTDGI